MYQSPHGVNKMNEETKWELLNEVRDLANFIPDETAIQKTAVRYNLPEQWLAQEYFDTFDADLEDDDD